MRQVDKSDKTEYMMTKLNLLRQVDESERKQNISN
jgi:hypothetical protein